MLRRTLIPLAVLVALVLPSTAMATTQVALGGGVVARLSYQGRLPRLTNLSLSIKRNGKQLYHRPVTSKYCADSCQVGLVPSQKPVQVVNFGDTGGAPDVLLSLYTGGAHCCSVAQVFSYDPGTQTYSMVEHNFGDPGYRLERLSSAGGREFVTADDSFAYTFTDFAASGLPVQVLQLQGRSFDNVTTQFPGLIGADAKQWITAYRKMASEHYSDSVGVIAAWAADEYMLGHVARAKAFLVAQAKAGHLNSALSPQEGGGMKFVTHLEAFLAKRGYLPIGK
jgi:hypothetical protein